MQLISGEKDWKHVSVQKVVTLNICCNVACLTFHLPHITIGSSQSHQCQPTTGFFSETPTFGGMQHTFSHMKKLCILQGSVVTFFRCGGQGSNSVFSSEMTYIIWSMNNTVENDFFGFPKVKLLTYTSEVGNCTSYWCRIFSGFNTPKIIKIG